MTDHTAFRISFHRIDHKTRSLTHGKVYGLPYGRLTAKTEVAKFDLDEATYFRVLTELVMKSPKFKDTNWDWSAPDFSLPFHIPVNDLSHMVVACGAWEVAEVVGEAAYAFPEVLLGLNAQDEKGGPVVHYAYFEHRWDGLPMIQNVFEALY